LKNSVRDQKGGREWIRAGETEVTGTVEGWQRGSERFVDETFGADSGGLYVFIEQFPSGGRTTSSKDSGGKESSGELEEARVKSGMGTIFPANKEKGPRMMEVLVDEIVVERETRMSQGGRLLKTFE
jgi:hypothetical protein